MKKTRWLMLLGACLLSALLPAGAMAAPGGTITSAGVVSTVFGGQASVSGSTITLTGDVTVDSSVVFESGTWTLNLNGHTLSGADGAKGSDGYTAWTSGTKGGTGGAGVTPIQVTGGTLTIAGGTVVGGAGGTGGKGGDARSVGVGNAGSGGDGGTGGAAVSVTNATLILQGSSALQGGAGGAGGEAGAGSNGGRGGTGTGGDAIRNNNSAITIQSGASVVGGSPSGNALRVTGGTISPTTNTLVFPMAVDAGATWNAPANASVTVPAGQSLLLNGTLNMNGGDFINNGTTTVNGVLDLGDGDLVSSGTINGSGKILPESKRLAQSAPAAPTAKSISYDIITLNGISGGVNGVEYSRDGINWRTSTRFSELQEATAYTFYARYRANGIYDASPASEGKIIWTRFKSPSASVDYVNECLKGFIQGVTYKLWFYGGEEWYITADADGTIPIREGWMNGKSLYFIRPAEGDVLASDSRIMTIHARPAAPAPTAVNESVSGMQDGKLTGLTNNKVYQLTTDGITWESKTANANGEITGLASGTYTVRVAATSSNFSGFPSDPMTIGADSYTVTYAPGANGTGAQQTATKAYGTPLVLADALFTRSGYTQTGWATTDGGAKAYDLGGSYTAEADITLYPVWQMDTYTLSYDLDGGVPAAPNPGSYTVETETFTLNNPTREGCTFTGWSGTGLDGSNHMTVTIEKGSTGNRSYTAHWIRNTEIGVITPQSRKTAAPQRSISFTLNRAPVPDSIWRVYDLQGGGRTLRTDITATCAGDVLTLAHATDIPVGSYEVTCQEPGKAESAVLTLEVLPMLIHITRQPEDQSVLVGQSATFAVTAEGDGLRYQWQICRGKTWEPLEGATEASYTTSPVTLKNDGFQYRCLLADAHGQTLESEAATLHVSEMDLPQTGDGERLALWLALGLASCAGLFALLRRGRRQE